jgi:hypothetical protein
VIKLELGNMAGEKLLDLIMMVNPIYVIFLIVKNIAEPF